jgi:hypothetical protein
MRGIVTRLFLFAILCSPLGNTYAQGTITDNGVSFVRPASCFDITPAANMTGAAPGADPLFETGWWFRIQGDSQETFFPVPTTQNYTGNTSTLDWTDVNARGFSAQEISTVSGVAGVSGRVQMAMTITNLSATNPLVINIFHFIDIDAGGTAADDDGLLDVAPLYRINLVDNLLTTQNAQYFGVDADAYLALPFSGTTDVAALLSNATVNDFSSTGVPFTDIDFTGGMQWANETIAPGASATFVARFAINTTAFVELPDPLFSDGFEDPIK